jgi:hypothetical protein
MLLKFPEIAAQKAFGTIVFSFETVSWCPDSKNFEETLFLDSSSLIHSHHRVVGRHHRNKAINVRPILKHSGSVRCPTCHHVEIKIYGHW